MDIGKKELDFCRLKKSRMVGLNPLSFSFKSMDGDEYGVSITIENYNIAHFRTQAGLTCHDVRKLSCNVIHILTDLWSDNLPTDREDLFRFISYRCNIAEYPDLEEAHCDKILNPDGNW